MSTIGGADSAAAETVSGAANKTPSWRDHLPIHSAADLFPLMSESELRELGEDIKARGLVSPIITCGGKLLDGRNRLDAMELVGIKLDELWRGRKVFAPKSRIVDGARVLVGSFDGDPYDYVLSANLHRRHLTGEQKRELIAKVLKAKPEASNALIAKQVKADDKTVAKVRRKLESTSEIPKLEKTTGADGKQRKLRAKKIPEPKPPAPVTDHRVNGSAEASVEQRRAENARLAAGSADPDDYEEAYISYCEEQTRVGTRWFALARPPSQKLIDAIRSVATAWTNYADAMDRGEWVISAEATAMNNTNAAD
jgi:hypothetical protein